uniref:GDSL-type esterase/lipase family protein n=1 Tax=Thaumasiovibrio occultus TaxID=1891184 RepID=UPI000B34D42C|nr:GDSL-type esterase/lipase family protein [Thaumasiovibrio occultus]
MSHITFFGDSITEWALWEERLAPIQIRNLGIAGETTAQMLRRSQQAAKEPQLWVMAGINDIIQLRPVQEVISDYNQMLDQWQGDNVHIQSTLFLSSAFVHLNPAVTQLNLWLQEQAQVRGFVFHDINALFNATDYLDDAYQYDGVHLTEKAYQIWQRYLEQQLT